MHKNIKKREKIGIIEKTTLKTILYYILAISSVTSIMALFVIMPGVAIPFNLILKKLNEEKIRERKIYPADLRRIFERMKKQRLIKMIETNDGIKIIIKKDGVKKIIINNLDQLKFEKPKIWGGVWHIVIFDIPEKFKRERDAFVRKIKELNFYHLQKSVFVFPYPPNDLIDFLSEIYQISPYIRIIETSKIEGDKEIFVHFNLRA